MELNSLQGGPRKWRKRKGRGPSSGMGKTAGRGHKGQKARSGAPAKRGFEGGQMPLNRRLPKRGFWHGDRFPHAVVNLDVLSRAFDDGAEVTAEALLEKGLIEETKGGIKVLARGDIGKKLSVKAHSVSAGARQKIEAAGGTVEIVSMIKAKSA